MRLFIIIGLVICLEGLFLFATDKEAKRQAQLPPPSSITEYKLLTDNEWKYGVLAPYFENPESVTSIDLNGEQLDEIPKEIAQFTNLKYLNLQNTGLIDIPAELGQLKSLEGLNLSNNHLTYLPEELGLLENLEELNLSNNQLELLPDAINGLPNLKKLLLENNEFGLLSSNNFLTKEPLYFPKLEILDVSLNQLKGLQFNVNKQHNLIELKVNSNRIATFPKSWEQLSSLEKLNLSNNLLEKLPEGIAGLQNLQGLNASFNLMKEIPISLTLSKKLHYLILRHNRITLQNIPELSVERLDLSDNEIEVIPPDITQLKAIKDLTLQGNHINSIDKSISQLEFLERLDLANNELEKLPNSINQLKNLTRLALHGNYFSAYYTSNLTKKLKGVDVVY